jgi:hypothetical protein
LSATQVVAGCHGCSEQVAAMLCCTLSTRLVNNIVHTCSNNVVDATHDKRKQFKLNSKDSTSSLKAIHSSKYKGKYKGKYNI